MSDRLMTDNTIPMVTQADRDAAADLSEQIAGKSNGRDQIAECRAGKQDATYLVQAFARHRTAAQPEREAGLRSKLRCVISHATGGETDDPDLSLNEICVRISAFRNKLYQAGKDAALATPAPAETGRERLAKQVGAAIANRANLPDPLTTPAPAVSTEEIVEVLEDAGDHLRHFVGSSYCETDKEDEVLVARIDDILARWWRR